MRRGVIVDRDGTLIDFYRDTNLGVVTPAFHPNQLRLLPGVVAGLHALQAAGYVIAIATNQPDAAKGALPREAIERTNQALVELLAAEGIRVATLAACLHHPEGGPGGDPALIRACDCRKPKPGLLERIIAEQNLDRSATWMIGDTAADLGAAQAAGIPMALVMQVKRCELCKLIDVALNGMEPALRAPNLAELAAAILAS